MIAIPSKTAKHCSQRNTPLNWLLYVLIHTKFITDYLTYGFWIGDNDLKVEGQWTWSDGTLFSDHSFKKWGKSYHGAWLHEPNNYLGHDHCLKLLKAINSFYPAFPEIEYTWHDSYHI